MVVDETNVECDVRFRGCIRVWLIVAGRVTLMIGGSVMNTIAGSVMNRLSY